MIPKNWRFGIVGSKKLASISEVAFAAYSSLHKYGGSVRILGFSEYLVPCRQKTGKITALILGLSHLAAIARTLQSKAFGMVLFSIDFVSVWRCTNGNTALTCLKKRSTSSMTISRGGRSSSNFPLLCWADHIINLKFCAKRILSFLSRTSLKMQFLVGAVRLWYGVSTTNLDKTFFQLCKTNFKQMDISLPRSTFFALCVFTLCICFLTVKTFGFRAVAPDLFLCSITSWSTPIIHHGPEPSSFYIAHMLAWLSIAFDRFHGRLLQCSLLLNCIDRIYKVSVHEVFAAEKIFPK